MIITGIKAKEIRMRIQRLKDGVLWIAASNDEKVNQIIISAGTWKAVYDLTSAYGFDEEEMLEGEENEDY